jgi:hypothetical protein
MLLQSDYAKTEVVEIPDYAYMHTPQCKQAQSQDEELSKQAWWQKA